MGLWDSLFGKKVVVSFQDDRGETLKRTVTAKQLAQWEADGKVDRLATVKVHMLEPSGTRTTVWEIGKDVPEEVAKQALDPETGCLYAMTYLEAGRAKTVVMTKAKWLLGKQAMGE